MKKTISLILLLAVASLLAPTLTGSPSPSGPRSFEARMTGEQENPPVETTGHGLFTAVLNEEETALSFTVNIFDFDLSTIFAAHIHVGPIGVNGPVILFLFDSSKEGPWVNPRTGTLTATNLLPKPAFGIDDFADVVDGLRSGRLYANAHSFAHGGGEVRGQIGVSAPVDIKPGSDPNSVNVRSTGVIPVAILTTPGFDASGVDVSSLGFGRDGIRFAASPVHSALEDVDGDGDLDLILQFLTQDTNIIAGDTFAAVWGRTIAGMAIAGIDRVRAFFPGDVNGDLTVNILDLILLGSSLGSEPGSPRWNLNADFDENRVINILDLVLAATYFGQHA